MLLTAIETYFDWYIGKMTVLDDLKKCSDKKAMKHLPIQANNQGNLSCANQSLRANFNLGHQINIQGDEQIE